MGALEKQAQPTRSAAQASSEDLALPYHVTVKPAGEDDSAGWIASLDELPGCEVRGPTQEQAVENLRGAMESWLSAAVEEPRVITPPKRATSKRRKASSHSGRFLVRMPSALHEELTQAAEREQVSLNRFVTARLAASVASSATPAHAPAPAGGSRAGRPRRRRGFRVLLAANLAVIVIAAAAAVTLLVLALERGI